MIVINNNVFIIKLKIVNNTIMIFYAKNVKSNIRQIIITINALIINYLTVKNITNNMSAKNVNQYQYWIIIKTVPNLSLFAF